MPFVVKSVNEDDDHTWNLFKITVPQKCDGDDGGYDNDYDDYVIICE